MSTTGTGSKRGTPRKRVKIVQITVDGVEVDAKECTKCGEVKALTEYNADRHKRGGKRSNCRDCERKYRESNKDRLREYDRNRYVADLDRYRIRDRIRYEVNPESARKRMCKYYRSNKSKYNAANRRYRSIKRSVPCIWTTEHESIVTILFNSVCTLSLSSADNHVDHVIPLAWGHGGSYVGNMIPLSSSINISKSDAHFYDWFEANRQRFKLDQSRFDSVVEYLAEQNGLTPDEFRSYVDWCYDNKRSLDEILADNKRYGYVVTSVELWRDATGRALPLRIVTDNQPETLRNVS